MVGRVYGLDFGTTNSLISVIQGDVALSLVDRASGRPHPSVVWYRGDEVVVGRVARDQLDGTDSSPPQGLLRSPKMTLRRGGMIHIDGREVEPSDAIKEVLAYLRADALEPRLTGIPHEVDRVVMTIPVDFEGPQRRELRNAARKAGLGVVQFVHEPVAALYAHLRSLPNLGRELAELENRVLLVFDWGGGTLDLTLCRVLGGTLTQIASVGDNEIGGDVFDERLRNLVRMRFGHEHSIDDVTSFETPGMGAKLLALCETMKIELVSGGVSPGRRIRDFARVDGVGRSLAASLSRVDLEREGDSLVRRGLKMIDDLLSSVGLDYADVHRCLPTGGMVNMPAIRNGLVERFGGRVPKLPNGDRIISEGAAWIAHDGLRLTLAKPLELRVADGSGAGHYHVLVAAGVQMPVENENLPVAMDQFLCTDPRNGVAVFEVVKPKRVGLIQPTDPRETLCEVQVEVDPKSKPLLERLACEVSIDHDYVAHVTVRSLGRGSESTEEIHRLDFGLALPVGATQEPLKTGSNVQVTTGAGSRGQFGSAPISGVPGAVAFRPNVVFTRAGANAAEFRSAVAGDLAQSVWPDMFNADRREATQYQSDEASYYWRCSVCGRTPYQIQSEPPTDLCRRDRCHPRKLNRHFPAGIGEPDSPTGSR
jgi:molecular chaperone DnaK